MINTKKLILGLSLFANVGLVCAQTSQECTVKYSLFKGNVLAKKYTEAKPELKYLITNCPKLSINIYKYGANVSKATKDADLMKLVYNAQLANFPNKDVAKAHDSYATFLIKNKLGTDSQIEDLLAKAYKSPKDMSVKNIFRYFDGIYVKNKDVNPEMVFETYDNVLESIEEKLDYYNSKMAALLEKETEGTLSAKDTKYLNAYRINSKALGQVQIVLDKKVEALATCDRLIPMLSKGYTENKSNVVWLKRSAKRLSSKDCKTDPFYEKLIRAFAETSQSASAYNFLAGVLDRNGDSSGAKEMRVKAFNLETDPIKKAKLKYVQAQEASRLGQNSKSRTLAREALKFNPNYGKPYLLIASLYQKSANSCGKDEFEKRMVYVAALAKAKKAQHVDPSCGAARYIRSYQKNIPSKKVIFQKGVKGGSSYRVGCWIGETVTVPNI